MGDGPELDTLDLPSALRLPRVGCGADARPESPSSVPSWPEGPWGQWGNTEAHRGGAPRGLCQLLAICSGMGIRVCAKANFGQV